MTCSWSTVIGTERELVSFITAHTCVKISCVQMQSSSRRTLGQSQLPWSGLSNNEEEEQKARFSGLAVNLSRGMRACLDAYIESLGPRTKIQMAMMMS